MDKTAAYSKAFLESIHGISADEVLTALLRLNNTLKRREESHLYPRILKNVVASLEYREYAEVISAHELDEMQKSEVAEKIKKQFPEMREGYIRYTINEKILGGIEIKYRDFLFDGSVSGTLKKILNTK